MPQITRTANRTNRQSELAVAAHEVSASLARDGKPITRRSSSRLRTCAQEDASEPIRLATQHNAVPGLTPAGEALRLAAEQHNARFLVIDTLGVANGASEIDRAKVGAFFADCAVLLTAHPPKTAGVAYSGSAGILGGVRAMWTIESVRRDCQGNCRSPRNCTCEPAYAYRLVNAKQNYSEATGLVWLTNQRGI